MKLHVCRVHDRIGENRMNNIDLYSLIVVKQIQVNIPGTLYQVVNAGNSHISKTEGFN